MDDRIRDGLGRAVVRGAVADAAVFEAAQLSGPRRDDQLAEQAGDVGGDARRGGPARRSLEQDLAGSTLAQRRDGVPVGAGQVIGDDEAVRGGLAGIEVRYGQAEHRGGRGADDLAGAVGQR
jgi:hypothetical protein